MTAINKLLCSILLIYPMTAFACNTESVVWNDILECYMSNEKEQEIKLNEIYQQTLKALPRAKRRTLKHAQKHWRSKIEKYCNEFANQNLYGREGVFDAIQCKIDAMKEREAFLIKYP